MSIDFQLYQVTSEQWVQVVLQDFNHFLVDHALCERKASAMAMSMVAHYPDRLALVNAMVELAIEELQHFKAVLELMQQRALVLSADEKDPYVNQLRQSIRTGKEAYLLDRLLVASIVEARGYERFSLIAEALPDGSLRDFYQRISLSEKKHYQLFLTLAQEYFPVQEIRSRLKILLVKEAEIIQQLHLRAALH